MVKLTSKHRVSFRAEDTKQPHKSQAHRAIPDHELFFLLSVMGTLVGTHLALYVTTRAQDNIQLSSEQERCSERRRMGEVELAGKRTRTIILQIADDCLPFYHCYSLKLMGCPDGSAGKESTCGVGDLGSIPGLWRSPGEGNGYPLQYSGLENSMDCYSPWGCKESDTTERLSLKQKRQRTEASGLYYSHWPCALVAYSPTVVICLCLYRLSPGKEQRLYLHSCILWAFPAVSLY